MSMEEFNALLQGIWCLESVEVYVLNGEGTTFCL